MSEDQSTRLAIELEIPQPDGTVLQDIPYGEVTIGPFLGDAEPDYEDDLVEVTPANLSELAGLSAVLDGLEIEYGAFGKTFHDTLPKLTFAAHPDHWVETIVAQDPELRVINALLLLIQGARKNPFLKRELTQWLKQYADGEKNCGTSAHLKLNGRNR